MADTPQAPASADRAPVTSVPQPGMFDDEGSMNVAAQAFLGLMDPPEDTPEAAEEAAPEVTEEAEAEPEVEASAETEEEAEESEEAEAEEVDEEGPDLYAIMVDGNEETVTLDELTSSYLRQSDYTKKTQAIAEQRKEVEEYQAQVSQERHAIQQERQQYVDALQRVIENSNLGDWANVDWAALKEQDPIEYVTRKEEFREAQEKIQGAQQEQQRVMALQNQEAHRVHQEALVRENEAMASVLPEWADPDKQRELADKLRVYANSVGYVDEEINSLVDHRSLIVLRKAMLYDQIQNSDVKSKKVRGKPKVIRAGQGVDKKAQSRKRRTAKITRLKQTGHVNDAAAAFEDLLG